MRRTATLLKLQGSRLRTVIVVITWHCIIGTHAIACIGLGHLVNDFYIICGDEEKYEIILHLLCTSPALGRERGTWVPAMMIQMNFNAWMVPEIGENVKLQYYNDCVRPKCVRSCLHWGDSLFYIPTYLRHNKLQDRHNGWKHHGIDK